MQRELKEILNNNYIVIAMKDEKNDDENFSIDRRKIRKIL